MAEDHKDGGPLVVVSERRTSFAEYSSSVAAMDSIAKAVADAQQVVMTARLEAEKRDKKPSAVIDAVSGLLLELKSQVKGSRNQLDIVKEQRRSNLQVALWVLVLLGLQFGFVLILEAVGDATNRAPP